MCSQILKEDEKHFMRAFTKLTHGIKAEMTSIEMSFHSLLTQFSLLRATQDLINDGKGTEAVGLLYRLASEVSTNQKYIYMSHKITE
jgi:hypothetical protein